MRTRGAWTGVLIVTMGAWMAGPRAAATSLEPSWLGDATAALEQQLVDTYGEGQRARSRKGLTQAASFWRVEDGDREVFEALLFAVADGAFREQ